MSQIQETAILEKRVWNTKQITIAVGFVLSVVGSIGGVYNALDKKTDKNSEALSHQKEVDARQDDQLKKMDEKLDKEVYNAEQLSYRLTSANKKYIEKLERNYQTMNTHMIEQRVKSDYIVKILEELKGKIK